jgi:carbon storage regulator
VLILSRKVGESIVIGDDVVVRIVEVRGDVVRLGIDAPRSTPVHREEVRRELEAANRSAASPSESTLKSLADLVRKEPPAAS